MTHTSIILTSQSCSTHRFTCFLTHMFKPVGLHIFKMFFPRHNSRNGFGFLDLVWGFFFIILHSNTSGFRYWELKTNLVRFPKWMITDPTILSPRKPRFLVQSHKASLHTATVVLETSISDNNHNNRLSLQKSYRQNTQAKYSNIRAVQ